MTPRTQAIRQAQAFLLLAAQEAATFLAERHTPRAVLHGPTEDLRIGRQLVAAIDAVKVAMKGAA